MVMPIEEFVVDKEFRPRMQVHACCTVLVTYMLSGFAGGAPRVDRLPLAVRCQPGPEGGGQAAVQRRLLKQPRPQGGSFYGSLEDPAPRAQARRCKITFL